MSVPKRSRRSPLLTTAGLAALSIVTASIAVPAQAAPSFEPSSSGYSATTVQSYTRNYVENRATFVPGVVYSITIEGGSGGFLYTANNPNIVTNGYTFTVTQTVDTSSTPVVFSLSALSTPDGSIVIFDKNGPVHERKNSAPTPQAPAPAPAPVAKPSPAPTQAPSTEVVEDEAEEGVKDGGATPTPTPEAEEVVAPEVAPIVEMTEQGLIYGRFVDDDERDVPVALAIEPVAEDDDSLITPAQEIDPSDPPVDPGEPVDPDPTEPTEPTDPAEPEPTDDPSDPVEPDPSDPVDPTDPPTDPEEPTDPVEPEEPEVAWQATVPVLAWHDTTEDGVREGAEPVLPGSRIVVRNAADPEGEPLYDSVSTIGAGEFTISSFEDADMTLLVTVTPPEGYLIGEAPEDTTDFYVSPEGTATMTVGATSTGPLFIPLVAAPEPATGTISVRVWVDRNTSGAPDAEDVHPEGRSINLSGYSVRVVSQAGQEYTGSTNEGGVATFENLPVGTYQAWVTPTQVEERGYGLINPEKLAKIPAGVVMVNERGATSAIEFTEPAEGQDAGTVEVAVPIKVVRTVRTLARPDDLNTGGLVYFDREGRPVPVDEFPEQVEELLERIDNPAPLTEQEQRNEAIQEWEERQFEQSPVVEPVRQPVQQYTYIEVPVQQVRPAQPVQGQRDSAVNERAYSGTTTTYQDSEDLTWTGSAGLFAGFTAALSALGLGGLLARRRRDS